LIMSENVDLIHTHDTHSFIDAAICKLLRPRLKYVHTFHWGNYPVLPPNEERVERLLWRLADALVCVGHEQAAAVRKLYGIPEDRIRVIWNGTEPQQAQIAPEVTRQLPENGVPVICSISTLIPQKGLEDLLQAAALLKRSGHRFRLLVVGEGRLRTVLEALARSLDLGDTVVFLGWVNEASRSALPACDIFVQSSHWEAMSVVVIEAMAAGKPVVATRVGENSRVIKDEVDGLLVPPREPEKLAHALARMLRDEVLRHRLAAAARRTFESTLTTDRMIRAHEELYLGLTSG
jgi:glycosyltransferase involved in cell wall biosynthesis